MKVKSLAYVGIETKEFDSWNSFSSDVLGLMPADSSNDFLKFKLDDRSFRIAIHKGKEEKLKYVGFELRNKSQFHEAKKELKKLKIQFSEADKEGCIFKDVKEMIHFHDPIGTQIDLFYGRTLDYQKFISPVGVTGFVTGEMGLGHVVLPTLNLKENFNFYTNVLGFAETDFMTFTMGEGDQAMEASLHFLHCDNPRHHSVGLFQAPDPTGLIHLMLEVKTLDDVGYALDRAKRAGVHLQSSLGRHSNDKMVSFYMVTPGGFAIEYGFDGWQVDWDEFTPTISHAPDLWGHEYNP
ncbi:MAG: VOC family protein [SAR86 cluster bacterium]|nr:VOC family protein [SAR86 cluster bacterium]|tara:strand:- start:6738 stop:7622 length:885 start_codon:yes stop_codon:yes gene_type:complete